MADENKDLSTLLAVGIKRAEVGQKLHAILMVMVPLADMLDQVYEINPALLPELATAKGSLQQSADAIQRAASTLETMWTVEVDRYRQAAAQANEPPTTTEGSDGDTHV